MFGVKGLARDAKVCTTSLELLIQSVFVREQVFKSSKPFFPDQGLNLGRERLLVLWIVKGQVDKLVSLLLELLCELAHGQEKANHFLDVVGDVVGLLTHFQHQVGDGGVGHCKPGMLAIELVSQYQTEDFRHKKRALVLKPFLLGNVLKKRVRLP